MKFTIASLVLTLGSASAFVANSPSKAFGTQLNMWSSRPGNYAPTKASWKTGGAPGTGGALGTGYSPGASAPVAAPTPAPAAPSTGGPTMDDLARQWAAMNQDTDGAPAPVAAAPVAPARAAPAAPAGDQWSNLAAEWMNMNNDV